MFNCLFFEVFMNELNCIHDFSESLKLVSQGNQYLSKTSNGYSFTSKETPKNLNKDQIIKIASDNISQIKSIFDKTSDKKVKMQCIDEIKELESALEGFHNRQMKKVGFAVAKFFGSSIDRLENVQQVLRQVDKEMKGVFPEYRDAQFDKLRIKQPVFKNYLEVRKVRKSLQDTQKDLTKEIKSLTRGIDSITTDASKIPEMQKKRSELQEELTKVQAEEKSILSIITAYEHAKVTYGILFDNSELDIPTLDYATPALGFGFLIEHLEEYMKSLSGGEEVIMQRALLELKAALEIAKPFYYGDPDQKVIQRISEEIVNQCAELNVPTKNKPSESVIIPGGYTPQDGGAGHAVIYKIEKEESGKYSFTIINTDKMGVSLETEQPELMTVKYIGIDPSKITPEFISGLLRHKSSTTSTNTQGMQEIGEQIERHFKTGGAPVFRTPGVEKLAQVKNSCGVQSIMSWLEGKLGEGFPKFKEVLEVSLLEKTRKDLQDMPSADHNRMRDLAIFGTADKDAVQKLRKQFLG